MVGRTVSHYKILSKLGEGGMGEVWLAEDTRLERRVALKFLAAHLVSDPEVHKRFEREAKSAAGLSHANICTVYEIDEADGKPFLAAEYIDGESLEAKIEQGPLKLSDAVELGRRIADGLQAAHQSGIVHRDIKPGNILVTSAGQVKILDFGLALLTEASKLTKVDTAVGTAAYMSPEQSQGGAVDLRTDIWAFGCLLHEMVCGQRAFQGHYDQALVYSILNEDPEPLSALRTGVPMELEAIVGKCLAKSPEDRYQHTDELIVDLRAVAKRLESGTARSVVASRVQAPPPGKNQRERPRSSAYQNALAALCLLSTGLAGYFWWSGSTPQQGPVRHFTIELDQQVIDTAVSPDGRHIAYVAGAPAGPLWIVDLRSGVKRQVESSAALRPFWSPDSSELAFGGIGGLRRLVLSTGAIQTIAPGQQVGAGANGGAWSRDGESVVVASGYQPTRLHQIALPNGAPEPLFAPDAFKSHQSVRAPHYAFGADEPNKISFFVEDSVTGANTLMIADLDSGDMSEIGLGSDHAFSPDGQIIFERVDPSAGSQLLAGRITGTSGDLSGSLSLVGQSSYFPSVSDDGTLVYVSYIEERVQLAWYDRSGVQLSLLGQPQDEIRTPRLSPDGSRVAVYGMQDGGSSVWVHQSERSIKTRLTPERSINRRPIWSPKGDRIAFLSSRSGAEDLYIKSSTATGEAKKILDQTDNMVIHDWSADGRYIVFQVQNPGSRRDLRFLEHVGGDRWESNTFLETEADERVAVFSPDGRYLAYLSDESGRDEVYVKPFPSGPGKWQVSENGGTQPHWEGDEIFFVSDDTLFAAQVSQAGGFRVRSTERLFQHRGLVNNLPIQSYDVAPGGEKFVLIESIKDDPVSTIHIIQNWAASLEGAGER